MRTTPHHYISQLEGPPEKRNTHRKQLSNSRGQGKMIWKSFDWIIKSQSNVLKRQEVKVEKETN